LLKLSDVVGPFSEDPPAEPRRQEIAEWLGHAVAWLEGPLGDYVLAGQAVRVAQRLRARLGESLLPHFEAGRLAVSRRHQLLQSHQLVAVNDAEIQRNEDLEETQAARDDLDEEREQLQMTREEWDDWITEQVGDVDAKLEALQKHHDQVSEQQSDVSKAAFQVRTEIVQVGILEQQARQQITAAQLQAVPGQTFIVTDPFLMEQQLFALQAEFEQYAAEYNALEQERLQLLSGAEQLFAEREASIARYQKATGNAAERLRQIDRWDRRLEREAKQAEGTDLENSRQVRNVRHRIKNWSTYDPFDLDAEPVRLLAEFQLSAP
jgi:hypothetical protein